LSSIAGIPQAGNDLKKKRKKENGNNNQEIRSIVRIG
jgi:hypothetical protein